MCAGKVWRTMDAREHEEDEEDGQLRERDVAVQWAFDRYNQSTHAIVCERNKSNVLKPNTFSPQTATFQRKALRPITLSDGTSIPPGTYTFSPAHAINFDPTIYPNPQTFDGLRFYNLRRSSPPEGEKKHQLTSVTKTELQFGAGRHACPGRWFAGHQIKMVLAAVVGRYEVRLKDGEGRPKSIVFQTNQFPDPKAEIVFKDRKFAGRREVE